MTEYREDLRIAVWSCLAVCGLQGSPGCVRLCCVYLEVARVEVLCGRGVYSVEL